LKPPNEGQGEEALGWEYNACSEICMSPGLCLYVERKGKKEME
jgi:hypothetical protein